MRGADGLDGIVVEKFGEDPSVFGPVESDVGLSAETTGG